jgi:hypothetical protein
MWLGVQSGQWSTAHASTSVPYSSAISGTTSKRVGQRGPDDHAIAEGWMLASQSPKRYQNG